MSDHASPLVSILTRNPVVSLATTLSQFEDVKKMGGRLQSLLDCPVVWISGSEAVPYVSNTKTTVSGLISALKEALHHFTSLEEVLRDEFHVSTQIGELQNTIQELDEARKEICMVEQAVMSTQFPLLTQCEYLPSLPISHI